MLARIRMLREAARLLRDPDRLGDGAILKSEAAGVRATPEVEAKLVAVRGFVPAIDLERLRSLPPGTLGRAYADFMHDNGLHPFRVTDAYRPLAAKNTFALRYAVTHDLFHVLLGFDTSWTGEMGVLAFACAQRYVRMQSVALALAAILYPLWAPRQAFAIWRAMRAGLGMGARAQFLLGERLEDRFEEPLAHVRASYAIEPWRGERDTFPRALGAPS